MKHLLTVLCICLSLLLQAQHTLVFKNVDSSKIITIKQKDLAKFSFNGYMNQQQVAEGVVTSLNDSTITLLPRKKLFTKKMPVQTLYIKDITGFKRYSKFRPAGEIIYGVVGVGIAGTVTAIVANAKLPAAASFATAAGTSMVTGGLKNIVLPTKIKNTLSNGWTMQVQNSNN
jgi:hypothetical protein